MCQVTIGRQRSPKHARGEHMVPYLRAANVKDGYLVLSDVLEMNFTPAEQETYRLLSGDVLVTEGCGSPAELGASAPWLGDSESVVCYQNTLLRLRAVEGSSDSGYLAHLARWCHHTGRWLEVSSGASILHIGHRRAQEVTVPCPPIPIQRKISTVLSAYDDLIENNRRRIELLEEMAQRTYREWFVDYRYPGHEDARLVGSALGPIPSGWEVKTLADVCVRITDGAHASPPSTDEGLPMASVKDMADFSLDIAGCRRISVSDFESLARQGCKPVSGDVLISKDGAKYLEKVFPVFGDLNVVLLSSIAILRPSDLVTPSFLVLMAKDPQTRLRMKGLVSGAAIPRVVLKDFKNFQLVLPPPGLQLRFDEVAGRMLRLVIEYETANRTLRDMRDLLLPRLISGAINVEDLDISAGEVAA